MIHTTAATVFTAWATGCLVWQIAVGSRRVLVFGAAWVIRVAAFVFAVASLAAAGFMGWVVPRDLATAVMLVVTATALGLSITDHRAFHSESTGPDAPEDAPTPRADRLDAVAVLAGMVAVVFGTIDSGGPAGVALTRALVALVALGGLTFTMIFGHRLLVKPYLGREPLELATKALVAIWPLEVAVMLLPTGMASVISGAVDDGFAGIMGWMWVMCALSTGVLAIVALVILADREEAKPASATGMLYLAGLTGFGAVLISRAVLGG